MSNATSEAGSRRRRCRSPLRERKIDEDGVESARGCLRRAAAPRVNAIRVKGSINER